MAATSCRFCYACGTNLGPRESQCPSCGTVREPDSPPATAAQPRLLLPPEPPHVGQPARWSAPATASPTSAGSAWRIALWRIALNSVACGLLCFVGFVGGIVLPRWFTSEWFTSEPPKPRAAWEVPSWEAAGSPLLWRITAPNGHEAHLFGTMHIGVQLSDLPPVVRRTLDQAEKLVVEADDGAVADSELMAQMMLPSGVTLEKLVGPQAWKKIPTLVPDIPKSTLRRLQPWAVVAFMMARSGSSSSTGAVQEGLDLELVRRARNAAKDVGYLETPEEQIALLRGFFDAQALIMLAEHPELAKVMIYGVVDDLVDVYLKGDVAALEELLTAGTGDPREAEFTRKSFTDRNQRWMPKIERMIRQQDGVFVAVGAGHLVGPEGLVNLLRRRGYRVERVSAGEPIRGTRRLANAVTVQESGEQIPVAA